MFISKSLVCTILAALLCVTLAIPVAALPEQTNAAHKVLAISFTGAVAWNHAYHLSEVIGSRQPERRLRQTLPSTSGLSSKPWHSKS